MFGHYYGALRLMDELNKIGFKLGVNDILSYFQFIPVKGNKGQCTLSKRRGFMDLLKKLENADYMSTAVAEVGGDFL